MFSSRSLGIRTLGLLFLLATVTVSFWGWLVIWNQEFLLPKWEFDRYLIYNEFLLIGISFASGGRQRVEGAPHEFVVAARRSCRQAAFGLFVIVIVAFAFQDDSASRWFFVSYVPILFAVLFFSNYKFPTLLSKWVFSGYREERVALAGTLAQASQIKPWLDRKSIIGLQTIGIVSSDPPSATASWPFPLLGRMDQIEDILHKSAITQLIVLDLSIGSERLRRLTQLCEGAAVRLLALHDINSYFNHTTTTFEDDGFRFIGLREEPLESPSNRFIKRAMDVIVALPVVVLILPFTTLLVWILQRIQSPGRVLYRQTRVGVKGIPFTILKYRTMNLNHGAEAKQVSKGDSRIYPAGHWLRRLSIDELPQFINVLRGEMSLVGPRPHMPEHEDMWVQNMRSYVVRRFIRPGITGWAQVSGFRGEVHTDADIRQRVGADIYYLENWSFSLDCLIVLKTIKQCLLPPQSAY